MEIDQQAEIQQLQFIACGKATWIEPDSAGEQARSNVNPGFVNVINHGL